MYSVFINSCDAYRDCWVPCIELLRRNFPEAPPPIYLNTETEALDAGDDLVCTRVARGAARPLTWGRCLEAGLQSVEAEVILYLQEDYFLRSRVRAGEIARLAGLMLEHDEVAHIGLTAVGAQGPFSPSDLSPQLLRVAPGSPYCVNMQAGLWRTSALRRLLRPWENGWHMEIFGSLRARNFGRELLTVDPASLKSRGPILDYVYTGVEKGRWHPEVPALFRRFGIEGVDFGDRGFREAEPSRLRTNLRMWRRLATPPSALVKSVAELALGRGA